MPFGTRNRIILTSTVSGLIPQDPLQVGGPGSLRLHAGCSECVSVLPLPLVEPDLEAQTAHAGVVRHSNVARLRESAEIHQGQTQNGKKVERERPRSPAATSTCADLERVLVDINVVAYLCLLGLAEEDEIFEEKDPPHTLLLPEENRELVLPNQLTLLF